MNNFEDNDLSSITRRYRDRSKKTLSPWASFNSGVWNKIFLVSCVIGVSIIDPLFLYIPVINEDMKCLTTDQTMKIVAVILRSLTDFSYLLHLIFRLKNALSMAQLFGLSIYNGFPWFYLLVDILAILPIPQVIMLSFFSKLTDSRYLTTRKFLNFLLLLQYMPRILRVYLSTRDLRRTYDLLARDVWAKCGFNFYLYVIMGHIFGALWYFHAIFRETACWHIACTSHLGCIPSPFDCHANTYPVKNLTYLNEFCPVNPPNSTVFNFGIFTDAIESHILQEADFLSKFFPSFWWGLKNLSSFGQNLETSRNMEENFFAVSISILGLLLFIYLIGNLQTYMQRATKKSEATMEKTMGKLSTKELEIELYLSDALGRLPKKKTKVIKQYIQGMIKEDKDFDVKILLSHLQQHIGVEYKCETYAEWITKSSYVEKHERNTTEEKAELWLSQTGMPHGLRRKIMRYIRLRLQEDKDVHIGIGNILPILPLALEEAVKKYLCLPMLRKVPILEDMEEPVYETICNFLKPMTFAQNSYIIRKGEPLDMMLFITQGVVWTFGSNSNPMECLEKGDYYGNELIEWKLRSTSYSEFPISTANLKSHTKVEAVALMAIDLEHVLSRWWPKFSERYPTYESMPEGLKRFLVVSMQQEFRRNIQKKRASINNQPEPQPNNLSIDVR